MKIKKTAAYIIKFNQKYVTNYLFNDISNYNKWILDDDIKNACVFSGYDVLNFQKKGIKFEVEEFNWR